MCTLEAGVIPPTQKRAEDTELDVLPAPKCLVVVCKVIRINIPNVDSSSIVFQHYKRSHELISKQYKIISCSAGTDRWIHNYKHFEYVFYLNILNGKE